MMTGFLNARWRKRGRENEKKENITDLAPRWNQHHRKKNFKRIKNITSFVYHDDEKILFILSFSFA